MPTKKQSKNWEGMTLWEMDTVRKAWLTKFSNESFFWGGKNEMSEEGLLAGEWLNLAVSKIKGCKCKLDVHAPLEERKKEIIRFLEWQFQNYAKPKS